MLNFKSIPFTKTYNWVLGTSIIIRYSILSVNEKRVTMITHCVLLPRHPPPPEHWAPGPCGVTGNGNTVQVYSIYSRNVTPISIS